VKTSASSRTIVAILVFVALAIAFWMVLISPKREEADKLGEQVSQLEATLAQSQAAVAAGEVAQHAFPHDYQQLVVLGKAVPAGDESSSLLVQLNHIADRAGVTFESLKVGAADDSEPVPPVEEAAPEEAETAPETEAEAAPPAEESGSVPAAAVATESAAALQPIGAQIGPAGLSVLPYELAFKGSFFDVAGFIHGIDGLIHTRGAKLAVDGRLVTLDGFVLAADGKRGFPHLNANFSVTTYLVPPGQGLTAGASPTEPTEIGATPSTTVSNLR
jgi:Tfp pilus assembly protein PilO